MTSGGALGIPPSRPCRLSLPGQCESQGCRGQARRREALACLAMPLPHCTPTHTHTPLIRRRLAALVLSSGLLRRAKSVEEALFSSQPPHSALFCVVSSGSHHYIIVHSSRVRGLWGKASARAGPSTRTCAQGWGAPEGLALRAGMGPACRKDTSRGPSHLQLGSSSSFDLEESSGWSLGVLCLRLLVAWQWGDVSGFLPYSLPIVHLLVQGWVRWSLYLVGT